MPVTGAPDYVDGAFDAGDGYYLVTFGGDPAPRGPYATINAMAVDCDVREYPEDGYVVWVENGNEVSSVPSLNPDDLVNPLDVNESCGSCGADIGPSASFPWHYDADDCRAIREPLPLPAPE